MITIGKFRIDAAYNKKGWSLRGRDLTDENVRGGKFCVGVIKSNIEAHPEKFITYSLVIFRLNIGIAWTTNPKEVEKHRLMEVLK